MITNVAIRYMKKLNDPKYSIPLPREGVYFTVKDACAVDVKPL